MAFGFAGAAAGASKSLEDIVAQRILEQKLEAEIADRQQRASMEQQQFDQRTKEFGIESGQRQQQIDMQAGDRRARENDKGVRRMISESLMQGGTPDRKALAALQIEAGDAPTMLNEPKPERVPLHTVTVPGPNGRPMTKGVTDEELRSGVQTYEKPPAPEKPQRTELTPGQAFSATRQLRNDYVRETSSAKTVSQQLALMKSSIAAAEKGDLAAGSQGVLVTFQKILDPNSVVRESEYARSASGQSLLSQMEGAITKLQSGGAGVPVEQLKKFSALAEQFAKNQNAFAKESKAQIDAIAKEYNLNPDNITRDYTEPEEATSMDAQTYSEGTVQKPIPGIPGAIAESTDGGKTWKRVK